MGGFEVPTKTCDLLQHANTGLQHVSPFDLQLIQALPPSYVAPKKKSLNRCGITRLTRGITEMPNAASQAAPKPNRETQNQAPKKQL